MNTHRKLQPNTENDIWFFIRWRAYQKKKKLEEKPIYCSTYLALMLHKTTQLAMSLSFEGYFKIQPLLETTMRQSQGSQQLSLWMASHARMDFFILLPSQTRKWIKWSRKTKQITTTKLPGTHICILNTSLYFK